MGASAPAAAVELRAIDDAPGIETYRMEAHLRVGADPPQQRIEVAGVYGKEPARYDVQVTLVEGTQDPVGLRARQVDGTLYYYAGSMWAEVERFDLAEMTVVTPEHFLGMGDVLQDLGEEDVNGRRVRHLRADRDDLPFVQSGSDTIDFSEMDSATLDLWVDVEEHFIVRLRIEAQATRRDQTFPFDVQFEYTDFNEPIAIERPSPDETVKVEKPPSASQEEVDSSLGFSFPVPEESVVQIYGATVAILTSMPLEEARAYADRSMKNAGFTLLGEAEQGPGEFFTRHRKGERTLGIRVFQTAATGAMIHVNAVK